MSNLKISRGFITILAIIGTVSALLLIVLPIELGFYAMALLGFANFLMWRDSWLLTIADLGKITKTRLSYSVMNIVGGAVFSIIFGSSLIFYKLMKLQASIIISGLFEY